MELLRITDSMEMQFYCAECIRSNWNVRELHRSSRPCHVDLVFYNYFLKCFVLIDLKKSMVEHYDIGQMNLYLNYFRAEEGTPSDAQPIGIVLGAEKDDLIVEYATQGITNKLFVSRYQLYLPDKEQLRRELAIAIKAK